MYDAFLWNEDDVIFITYCIKKANVVDKIIWLIIKDGLPLESKSLNFKIVLNLLMGLSLSFTNLGTMTFTNNGLMVVRRCIV
jgi:hypothetical protein